MLIASEVLSSLTDEWVLSRPDGEKKETDVGSMTNNWRDLEFEREIMMMMKGFRQPVIQLCLPAKRGKRLHQLLDPQVFRKQIE